MGAINSTVLMFIGYKHTHTQTKTIPFNQFFYTGIMRIYKVEKGFLFYCVGFPMKLYFKTLLNIENDVIGVPNNINVISNPILKWLIKISQNIWNENLKTLILHLKELVL